jgi:hypothetical protein
MADEIQGTHDRHAAAREFAREFVRRLRRAIKSAPNERPTLILVAADETFDMDDDLARDLTRAMNKRPVGTVLDAG